MSEFYLNMLLELRSRAAKKPAAYMLGGPMLELARRYNGKDWVILYEQPGAGYYVTVKSDFYSISNSYSSFQEAFEDMQLSEVYESVESVSH
ncbi:MAG: hypothetical protein FMNOHCHN_03791 [Ignavibacteriaceae bacterium]|nr:hypothetical protein [Ignavibacteriaceae bacterium]